MVVEVPEVHLVEVVEQTWLYSLDGRSRSWVEWELVDSSFGLVDSIVAAERLGYRLVVVAVGDTELAAG